MSAGIVDIVVRISLALATTVLFGIVLMAYLRLKSRKMLFILIGFGIFFVHAIILVPGVFNEAYNVELDENVHLFVHLIGLIFILLGILKD